VRPGAGGGGAAVGAAAHAYAFPGLGGGESGIPGGLAAPRLERGAGELCGRPARHQVQEDQEGGGQRRRQSSTLCLTIQVLILDKLP